MVLLQASAMRERMLCALSKTYNSPLPSVAAGNIADFGY
jgi:hypothetical protein